MISVMAFFIFPKLEETMTQLTPLRLARLEKGLSQWEVSKRTGISQTMISLYEREYVVPNELYKAKLAKLYDKKVAELWR